MMDGDRAASSDTQPLRPHGDNAVFRKRRRRASKIPPSRHANAREDDELSSGEDAHLRERVLALREARKLRLERLQKLMTERQGDGQHRQSAEEAEDDMDLGFRPERGGAHVLDQQMRFYVDAKMHDASGNREERWADDAEEASDKQRQQERSLYEISSHYRVEKPPVRDPERSIPVTVQEVDVPESKEGR